MESTMSYGFTKWHPALIWMIFPIAPRRRSPKNRLHYQTNLTRYTRENGPRRSREIT